MEEQRENKIGSVLAWLQAGARGKTARMQFKKLQDQKMALYACQRAIRSYMMAKTWLWLQLWLSIKPKLGALEVGLDGKPELEPGLGHHVGTDGALAGVQGHLLVLQLLELHPGGLATGTGLQPGKDRSNLVLALLLHPATNAGPEEDEGVAQPELLLVQLDDVHHSLSGGLVVLGLELRIGQLVGEASTADGDSGEHTVALVLV